MDTRIPEYWILASLLAAAFLASVIGYALKRRRPSNAAIANLNARVRAWWVLIIVGGLALLAGRIAIILLFALLSSLALREFLKQTQLRPIQGSTWFLCFLVALPVQYGLIGFGWPGLFTIWIPVYCFVALAVEGVLFGGPERFLDRIAITQWGLIVCVYCVSYVPALTMLRVPGYERRTPLLVVFMVLIAQVSDIMQYIWGKLIGRRPVAPVLSPSKTVEGLFGGVLSATLLGALLYPITPFMAWQSALMAFLIAILGFLGGLVLSAIKRDRGIKEWGQSIAGHGGVLDRIDSLCFSAPLFFHVTRYFFSQR